MLLSEETEICCSFIKLIAQVGDVDRLLKVQSLSSIP